MRRTLYFLAALAVLPLLGSGSPRDCDDTTRENTLEGRWRCVRVRINGKDDPIKEEFGLIFRGNTCQWTGEAARPAEPIRLNMAPNPAHLDFVNGTQCIFRVEGDTLLFAFRRTGAGRPRTFDEEETWIETFKRVRR